jgi:hypothetical protein
MTRSLPISMMSLLYFWGVKSYLERLFLVDMSALDIKSILHGCHLYCVKDCLTNTYIQNVIKEDALPKFDRDDFCFYLINKKEESSKVSSVISVNKPPDYVEKLPFKPLPPKEVKKKKRRSKRREETVSSPNHVAPIIVFDESELDDVLMPMSPQEISKRYKRQSSGMPPRHPFFIVKNQVTFQDTIFLLLHILCVFLGASLLLLSVFFCFVCCNKLLDHIMFVLERYLLHFSLPRTL